MSHQAENPRAPEQTYEGQVLQRLRDLKTDNDAAHAEIKALLVKQNARIKKLELWRSAVVAVGTVLVAIGAFVLKGLGIAK